MFQTLCKIHEFEEKRMQNYKAKYNFKFFFFFFK